MKEIYKEVRLIGPDHNCAFNPLFSDGFRETEGCLIIGDGKEYLSEEEIKKQLTGRIDQNTRVHICAHGGIIENNTHIVTLIKNIWNTSFTLKLIDGLTTDPVQIYIYSCYSGAANNSVSCLKEGSVLITNSDANLTSVMSPFTSSFLNQDKSPEGVFLSSIRFASQTITYNKNIGNDKHFRFSYRPFVHHFLGIRNTFSKYILWAESLFITKVREYNCYFRESIEDLLLLEEVSEEEVKQTYIDYACYLILINIITPIDILKLLGAVNLDVNAKSSLGIPFLYFVSNSSVFNKEAFEAFVQNGADVNAKTTIGYPLLYFVSDSSVFNKEAFEAFVQKGADVNAKTKEGYPLLYFVSNSSVFNKEAFEAYVKKGADVNAKTKEGYPLLYYVANSSVFNKAAFEAYVKKGADVTAETDSGELIITEFLKSNIFNKDVIEAMLRSGAMLPQDKPLNVKQDHWHIAQELSKEFFKDDKDPLNKFNTRRELSKSVNFSKMFSCEDLRYALSSAKSFCARICSSQTDRERRVR